MAIQKHIGAVNPSGDSSEIGAVPIVDLGSTINLVVSDTYQLQVAENISPAQTYNLIVNDSYQVQAAENVQTTHTYDIIVNDSYQSQVPYNVTIVIVVVLVINDSYQVQIAEDVYTLQAVNNAITGAFISLYSPTPEPTLKTPSITITLNQ